MRVTLGLALALAVAGCGSDSNGNNNNGGGQKDLTFVFPEVDLSGLNPGDDGGGGGPNNCGDNDPDCMSPGFGPMYGKPFPLSTDMPKDPNESDNGVSRNNSGYLGLNSSMASFDYLWLANTDDWQRGSLTKMNSKTVREIARYMTFTCSSNPGGSKAACDGTNGCCAKDSYQEYMNRKAKMAPGPHQQIQQTSNDPSRTAIDFNGDAWVSNRAFGGQSSVTKVSNDPTTCVDRNKNGKIDTSSDVNGDGIINTDCNGNNKPDDLDDVKQTPCINGAKQEFFGLDDECVLFTTNTNTPDQWGRPLGLGPGAQDFGPSDAWAGGFNNGFFFRIDGSTGLTKDDSGGSIGNSPYGVAIDSSSYAWAPPLGAGSMCYFDTKAPSVNKGCARDPQSGQMNGYGVSLDRDQNIWFGGFGSGNAYRYTPDRTNGFKNLGQGSWVTVTKPGANATGDGGFATHRGIAVDSRTANTYFAWLADDNGWIIRIPASTIAIMKGINDQVIDGSTYPAAKVAGTTTIGAGVDRDQNVWGVSLSGSVATRIPVDANGMMTAPDINSAPMGNNKCPAGDRCPYQDQMNFSSPDPYTYSDFTGFGLRNFTRPKGSYSYVQKGCADGNGATDTKWISITYDADVPLNTALSVVARSGNTPIPDQSWGAWTMPVQMSPADLITNMALSPNLMTDGYLQVEFDFTTSVKNATPLLKSFTINYECPNIPG